MTLPSFLKTGLSEGIFSGRADLGPSSSATTVLSPFFPSSSTGTISAAKAPAFCASTARRVDSMRVLVLRRAGDVLRRRAVLGADAHVVLAVRVPQAVVDHPVDQLDVAHPRPGPRGAVVVGRVGHRLHAARHHHLGVPERDGLRAGDDRLEPGAAHLVERPGRRRLRQAGEDRRLARGRLSHARLEDVAHHHLVHRGGLDAGALQGGADGDGAEARRLDRRERSEERADGRARCPYDDHFATGHGDLCRKGIFEVPEGPSNIGSSFGLRQPVYGRALSEGPTRRSATSGRAGGPRRRGRRP